MNQKQNTHTYTYRSTNSVSKLKKSFLPGSFGTVMYQNLLLKTCQRSTMKPRINSPEFRTLRWYRACLCWPRKRKMRTITLTTRTAQTSSSNGMQTWDSREKILKNFGQWCGSHENMHENAGIWPNEDLCNIIYTCPCPWQCQSQNWSNPTEPTMCRPMQSFFLLGVNAE